MHLVGTGLLYSGAAQTEGLRGALSVDQSMGASVDKQGSLGLDQGMETESTHGPCPTGLTQLQSVPTTQPLVSTSEFLHLFPLPRKLFAGSPPRSGLSMNVGCAGRLTLSNP